MLEDLTRLHTQTIESSYLGQTTATAYELQIANLKKRIAFLEEEYDRRIAFIEDEEKITENRLNQAVEDLKTCIARIPYFHQRIAEVQNILNPPVIEPEVSSFVYYSFCFSYYLNPPFILGRGNRTSDREEEKGKQEKIFLNKIFAGFIILKGIQNKCR